MLPQLLLLRQTTVPTVIDSYYLFLLGGYRFLYLLNWIQRGLDVNERDPNAVSVVFGIIQVALFIDFAWVYWTRQRVKLRGGGVVDADDLRKGWLVNRVFKQGQEPSEEEDAEAGNRDSIGHAQPKVNRWGPRGISVSLIFLRVVLGDSTRTSI